MTALILVPEGTVFAPVLPVDNEGSPNGRYVYTEDPETGEMNRKWIPANDDIPDQPGDMVGKRFKCMARGFTDGGIRVAGTTERWSGRGNIDTVDYVSMKFPKDVLLTRRDRVTDIRNSAGLLLWKEEESTDNATVFDVNGVTPIVDPFGNLIEYSALLERAAVQ